MATLKLESGEDYLYSAVIDSLINAAVIDTKSGYAYFGTHTVIGKIVKIRLADFAEVSTLKLRSGESGLRSAVLDSINGSTYFGTNTAPGKIIKIYS